MYEIVGIATKMFKSYKLLSKKLRRLLNG